MHLLKFTIKSICISYFGPYYDVYTDGQIYGQTEKSRLTNP